MAKSLTKTDDTKMTSPTGWSSFTIEDLEADMRAAKAESSGGNYKTLSEGTHRVRILPGFPGQRPYVALKVHFFEDDEGKRRRVVCSRAVSKGKARCLFCEEHDALKSGNKLDQDAANKLRPSTKYVYQVIDRDQEQLGPMLMEVGWKIQEKLEALLRLKLYGDFSNPSDKGYDIIITRKGKGQFDTEYATTADDDKSPLVAGDPDCSSEEAKTILAERKDLRDLLVAVGVPEQRALKSGNPDHLKDEEDAPAPKKQRRLPTVRKTAAEDIETSDGPVIVDVEDAGDDDDDSWE